MSQITLTRTEKEKLPTETVNTVRVCKLFFCSFNSIYYAAYS